MKNLRVLNYELQATAILACITDGKSQIDIPIDRVVFEQWLTDGTGEVDMTFTHTEGDITTESTVKEPIAKYWHQGEEINNSPVLNHLRQYLTRDEAAVCGIKAEFIEEHLKDLFTQMEPSLRAEAYASLLEYGLHKKEQGAQNAAVVFKKILTGQAA